MKTVLLEYFRQYRIVFAAIGLSLLTVFTEARSGDLEVSGAETCPAPYLDEYCEGWTDGNRCEEDPLASILRIGTSGNFCSAAEGSHASHTVTEKRNF